MALPNGAMNQFEVVGSAAKRTEKYDVMKTLGKGTYGHCYKVKHKETGEILVLKAVSLQGLSKKDKEETKNEARLMQQLRHDNIIRHADSWCDDQWLFIVMEYAEGGDLGDLVASYEETGPTLSEERLWKYITDMATGLAFLHSKRVIHRDIKPSNIFLVGEKAVVADLGLGRLLSSSYACAYSKVGTPLYFSPEVCEEKPYDEKSDCWALGCLIYELATGQPPFVAANQVALARKVVTEQPTRLPSRFSAELRDLLDQMLCKDPRDRISMADILLYPSVCQTAKQLAREKQAAPSVTLSPRTAEIDTEAIKRVLEIQYMHEKQKMEEQYQQQLRDLEQAMQSRIDQLSAGNESSHKQEVLQLQKELTSAEERVLELSDKCLQLQAAYKEERGARLAADECNQKVREVHTELEASLAVLTQQLSESEDSTQRLQEKLNRELALKQELQMQLAASASHRYETAALHSRAAEQERQTNSLTSQLAETTAMLRDERERVEQYENLLAVLQERDERDSSDGSLEEAGDFSGHESMRDIAAISEVSASVASLDATATDGPQRSDSRVYLDVPLPSVGETAPSGHNTQTEILPADLSWLSKSASETDVSCALTAALTLESVQVSRQALHAVNAAGPDEPAALDDSVVSAEIDTVGTPESPRSPPSASPCPSSHAEAAEQQALQLLQELEVEGMRASPEPEQVPSRLPTELEAILSSVDRLCNAGGAVMGVEDTLQCNSGKDAATGDEHRLPQPAVDLPSPAGAFTEPPPVCQETAEPLLERAQEAIVEERRLPEPTVDLLSHAEAYAEPSQEAAGAAAVVFMSSAQQGGPRRRPSFSAMLQQAEEQLTEDLGDEASVVVSGGPSPDESSLAQSAADNAESPETNLRAQPKSRSRPPPKPSLASTSDVQNPEASATGAVEPRDDPSSYWAKEAAYLNNFTASAEQQDKHNSQESNPEDAPAGVETTGEVSFCMDDSSFDGILLLGSGPDLCEARPEVESTPQHTRPVFKLDLPSNFAAEPDAPGKAEAPQETADQVRAAPADHQESVERPLATVPAAADRPMSAALGAIAQAKDYDYCLDGGSWAEETTPDRMHTPMKGGKSAARSRSIALADLGLTLPPSVASLAGTYKSRPPEFPVLLAWQKAAGIRESKAGTGLVPRVSGTIRQNVWCNKERRQLSAGTESGLALFFRPSNLRPPVVRKVMVRRGCSPEFVRMELTPVAQLDASSGWWGLQGVVPVGGRGVGNCNPTGELVEVIIDFASPNPVEEMVILKSDARFRHLMVVSSSPLKEQTVHNEVPSRPSTSQAARAGCPGHRGATPPRQRPSSAGRARPGTAQPPGSRAAHRPATPTRRPTGPRPSESSAPLRRSKTSGSTHRSPAEQPAGPLSSAQVAALLKKVEQQRHTPRVPVTDPIDFSVGSASSAAAEEQTTAASPWLDGLQHYKAAARPDKFSNGLRISKAEAKQLEASDGSISAVSTPDESRIEACTIGTAPSTITSKLLEQLTMVAAESRKVIQDTASPTHTPDSKFCRPESPDMSRSPLSPTTRGNMPIRRSSGRKSSLRKSGKSHVRRSGETLQLCEEANSLQERLRVAVEILGGVSNGNSLGTTRARARPAKRSSSTGRQRRISSTS